jgi:hypothetical protein
VQCMHALLMTVMHCAHPADVHACPPDPQPGSRGARVQALQQERERDILGEWLLPHLQEIWLHRQASRQMPEAQRSP